MNKFSSHEETKLKFRNKFQLLLFPLHKHELGKFIPVSLLMFCILFNQNMLRILKDSILISEISVEISSFAKVYCVTPAAALFVVIYAKMVNNLSFFKIFYYLTAFFVSLFLLFAFLIYPNIDYFHIHSTSLNKLVLDYPYLKWYIHLFSNWSYILFYTLAELWPNIFYVLLFWQFANEITTTEEASRFYTLFSLVGNSSLVFVGFLMMNLASDNSVVKYFTQSVNNKVILVQVSVAIVAVTAGISCYVIKYISDNVMTDPKLYTKAKSIRRTKEKMGLIKSLKYITTSYYLWLMLICSAAFALSMNLVEAVWKAKMKVLYPTLNSYAEFNGLYILWTGVTIMVMTILGNNIMRRYGWYVTAVISPIIIMITGFLFFLLVVFDNEVSSLLDKIILMTPLALAVLIGAVQNILAKGTKYSIWDTSREMLYIPLDDELKTKGKAAVDVISSKIGKSSSGLLQSIVFTMVPSATVISISPILMVIFVFVCLVWIYSVKKIFIEYQKIV